MTRKLILIVLALSIAAPAAAKRMYKFVDENGVTHYTDRKPDTDQEVESRIVKVENKPLVSARRTDSRDTNTYHFFNHWHGPIEIRVRFEDANNVYAEPPLPASFLLQDYGEQPLVTVRPENSRATWGYRLTYDAVPGDPRAQVNSEHPYRLPFRASERYYVGQAFGGMATHTDKQSFHAVDITMPVGTPILAARDGIIMHIEEDFFGGGLDIKKYGTRANHVRILHEDGSMAVYAHLDLESVAVRPGQAVLAGELIGLSGNTGMSSGPHLHFVIQRNGGTELESVPFKFHDGRRTMQPSAGSWLEMKR
jgi:murein DD-endopeptidase MepM/ murein hydrolase activator NlpD